MPHDPPSDEEGFHVKPEAFTFEFEVGADSGFHVKPEAFAFEFEVGVDGGFHVKPEAFAFEFEVGSDSGFHVKPEAFAFEFEVGADSGFHVKPEAYAFNLVIKENFPVLKLAIRHNGEILIVPFTTKVSSPALVVRWNGLNWYNPLVSPTEASAVLTEYGGQTYALST